jgi:hypothetical protein
MNKRRPCFGSLLLRKTTALIALVWTVVSPANAHHLWIESTADGGLVARFAEWGNDFETSPGNLDLLSGAQAWKMDADGKPVALEAIKKSDGFQIAGASATNSVQLEIGFQVLARTGRPSRKPIFYARWVPAGAGAAKPSLNFDIVPTGNDGEFQVFLRGTPLPNADVMAHLPEGKEQELKADEKGLVRFKPDKPGLYVLSSAHQREEMKGFSGGSAYDALSHNCSVAWRQ